MKIKIIFLVAAFFMVYTAFCDTARIDKDQYIVKVGDVFSIQLMTIDSLVVKSVVSPEGFLRLYPVSTNVRVGGETLSEAYRLIYEKTDQIVSRDKIIIQLEAISPIRFHVLGAVIKPGTYVSEELITLQEALIMAEGEISNASKKIRILRNKEILEFDLNEYYRNREVAVNPLIMHDDVVMVNLAINPVRVYTNVDSLNLLESIELSDESATISEVLNMLTRRHQLSNLNVFTVERNNVYTVVDRDFLLQPNDTLFISEEELYVFVTGFVNSPGKVAYNGNLNAFYYLSQRGGPSNNGAKDKIYLSYEFGRKELYTNQEIKPGDTIYIPESKRSMFVSLIGPLSTVVTMVTSIIILSMSI